MDSFLKANGEPIFILGGQVCNSSAYDPANLHRALQALMAMHANTLEVPVYWEQVEAEEGDFNFDHLDRLLAMARQNDLKLIFLWFGTWKNGTMNYAPSWVKNDPRRFRRVLDPLGDLVWVLSSHCQENLNADRRAFCQLMAHLRQVDDDQHTVIAVQVENEPGILNCPRDFSPEAEAEFCAPVPTEVLEIPAHFPESYAAKAWEKAGSRLEGNWQQIFGPDAAEFFTAWSIAHYIDAVVEAGKKVFDIPMYVNVWLGEGGWRLPGNGYPSGGAVLKVLDVWKAIAPHIDLIAPDNYIEDHNLYLQVNKAYARPDNLLFVPESGQGVANAIHLFETIALGAIGYAVFGIEELVEEDGSLRPAAKPVVESMSCLAAAAPLLIRANGSANVYPVGQKEFLGEQCFDFGDYLGRVTFDLEHARTDYHTRSLHAGQRGRGLIIQTGPRQFYLTGAGFRLFFKKKPAEREVRSRSNEQWEACTVNYLTVEEGHFSQGGEWAVDRPPKKLKGWEPGEMVPAGNRV
ncbi:MAG: DUF5597 domain-containing protein [Omnitrophica WOR_2 bacterium]